MNYSQSVQYLYGLGHEVLAAKYRLENIQILLQALGNPQQSFQSILVAGTNGKGSVTAMIDAVLQEAGHHTGLYTSPHLVNIEERIQVGGEAISRDEFARCATLIRETSERLVMENRLDTVPTFFEQLTAIALNHFRESRVRLAVLEVGLGGRLDATNAVERFLSIVTAIDFDHQKILGETIAEIAAEKAAIIKKSAQAVIGRQIYGEAEAVLLQKCRDENLSPVCTREPGETKLINFGQPAFDYRSSGGNLYKVISALRGRHQADNAATAIEACEIISHTGFEIPKNAIISGLKNVRWPGRLELIEGNPLLLLDGAHNPGGAKVLGDFLRETWGGKITLIFAAMNDKDIAGIAREIFPLADKIIFTKIDERRAATMDGLAAFLPESVKEWSVTDTVEQAFTIARSVTSNDDMICVAGSLHLVGAIKKLLLMMK
jgi:dihydrofolate synthase/folylpolyglutamate synthase